MTSNVLLYPMFAHIALTTFLYVLLTLTRAPSVWNIGARADGSNPWQNIEPRISANLSNQFEWPLFFYIACVLFMVQGKSIDELTIWLAWIFIVGRLIHSYVHIVTNNIRVRGIVFTLNFLAALGMWLVLILQQFASFST